NVLVGNDGNVRLADYGLAKRLDASVSASCTPAFAAPEQLAGGEDANGVLVDVYSVGATLFALVTGKPPIPGRVDVFAMERRKVPRRLQAMLVKALSPDPEARYQDAETFASALDKTPLAPGEASPGEPSNLAKATTRPSDPSHASTPTAPAPRAPRG